MKGGPPGGEIKVPMRIEPVVTSGIVLLHAEHLEVDSLGRLLGDE